MQLRSKFQFSSTLPFHGVYMGIYLPPNPGKLGKTGEKLGISGPRDSTRSKTKFSDYATVSTIS